MATSEFSHRLTENKNTRKTQFILYIALLGDEGLCHRERQRNVINDMQAKKWTFQITKAILSFRLILNFIFLIHLFRAASTINKNFL